MWNKISRYARNDIIALTFKSYVLEQYSKRGLVVIRQDMPLVKVWRLYKGLTVEEVAEVAGLKTNDVQKLETADNQLSYFLEKVSLGLNLDIEQIVDLLEVRTIKKIYATWEDESSHVAFNAKISVATLELSYQSLYRGFGIPEIHSGILSKEQCVLDTGKTRIHGTLEDYNSFSTVGLNDGHPVD